MTSYTDWMRGKIETRKSVDGWVCVTTPFVDHRNDYIQYYVRREHDDFVLSDDGWALTEIETKGGSAKDPHCQSIMGPILRGLDVDLVDDELQVRATSTSFAEKTHDLIQAMLYVSDLSYLAGTRQDVPSALARPTFRFSAGVSGWLDNIGVDYTPKAKVLGASGFEHVFDFSVFAGDRGAWNYLQTFQRPTKANTANTIFAWTDTSRVRSESDKGFAILNDAAHAVKPEVASAIANAGMEVVPWSQRDALVADLASR